MGTSLIFIFTVDGLSRIDAWCTFHYFVKMMVFAFSPIVELVPFILKNSNST